MKHLEKTICMHIEQNNKIFVWEKKKKKKNLCDSGSYY